MSTSRSTSRASVANRFFAARVATAPISWGVCEVPGWGLQLPVERVLGEMAALGFTHTELGSAGWLPQDPDRLTGVLGRHGLSVLGSFVPLVLHDPDQADEARRQATAAAELLQAAGARYFNTAAVTSHDWAPRQPVSPEEQSHLYAMITELDDLCRLHGLVQVVHEHVGCVIETRDDVDALLEATDVKIVLDTGHLTLGDYDPLRFAETCTDRVGLVHLKDTRRDVARRLAGGQLSLMEAVQQGLFPPLGEGDLPLADIVDTLERRGYRGWYVIEQDCAITDGAPPDGAGPMADVATSIAFLNTHVSGLSDPPAQP